jgi:hypothetical protein
MRNSKFFLFVGFFITLVHVSFSQVQVHVGATTAYSATFVLDKGLSEDPRYNSTMTYNTAPIGFNFGVDFSNKFGLSLESILSNQGQIYEIINAAEQISGERKIDLKYMNLPLLLRFMSGGNGGARANFNIGPQLSFLTEASETLIFEAGNYEIPNDPEFVIPAGATDNGDGTYNIPEGIESPEDNRISNSGGIRIGYRSCASFLFIHANTGQLQLNRYEKRGRMGNPIEWKTSGHIQSASQSCCRCSARVALHVWNYPIIQIQKIEADYRFKKNRFCSGIFLLYRIQTTGY